MPFIHSEKEPDMKKGWEKSRIWEDKLGRDTNQPEIYQKNRPIYEVTRTDRPI